MMDRALKERIIGAAVLVLVVVLVVPVFLDGPPEEGAVVSERVPLPGQADQETRTVVLDRDRSSPVPATDSGEPAVTAPQSQPAPVTAATQSEPEPEPDLPAPQPAPAQEDTAPQPAADSSSTGMWAVQLGSFGNVDNARRLIDRLRDKGYPGYLQRQVEGDTTVFKVRVGPQVAKEEARSVRQRLIDDFDMKGMLLKYR